MALRTDFSPDDEIANTTLKRLRVLAEKESDDGDVVVHYGVWQGLEVAIKDISYTERTLPYCQKEKDILKKLSENGALPPVVEYYGYCQNKEEKIFSIVMEYLPKSMASMIDREPKPSPAIILGMMRELTAIIQYLHAHKIVHRDIKDENILIDRDGRIKLCDMGFATELTSSLSGEYGTPGWYAPEVLYSAPYTEKVDIFSLTCVLLQLITWSAPEETNPERYQAMLRENWRPKIPEDCPARVADLLRQGFWQQPTQRPSATQMLEVLQQEDILDGLSHAGSSKSTM